MGQETLQGAKREDQRNIVIDEKAGLCVWGLRGMSYLGHTCSDVTSCVTPQQSCRGYATAVLLPDMAGFCPGLPLRKEEADMV